MRVQYRPIRGGGKEEETLNMCTNNSTLIVVSNEQENDSMLWNRTTRKLNVISETREGFLEEVTFKLMSKG